MIESEEENQILSHCDSSLTTQVKAKCPLNEDRIIVSSKENDRCNYGRESLNEILYPYFRRTTLETTPSKYEVIEPGFVILRNFVSDSECQSLAEMIFERGTGEDNGFYCKNEHGENILNTGEKGRGRIYDAADKFPRDITEHCNRAVEQARTIDPMMPEMNCTHLLINMYTTKDGLVWHRDIYENDGSSDHPVVNLCVGASCLFGFNHNESDPERVIQLNSGDVLLFGGPCRLIRHAVLEVLLNEVPSWMKDSPVRLSFTYRDSPEVLGREEEFKYFRVKDHLVGQDDFEVPLETKDFIGLPSMATQRCV